MCRAIGETHVIALQPKDRLYYEKNCVGRARERYVRPESDQEKAGRQKEEAQAAAKHAAMKEHLLQVAAPFIQSAKATPIGTSERHVVASQKKLGKPDVSKDGTCTDYTWQTPPGGQGWCRLIMSTRGQKLAAMGVHCGGDDFPPEAVWTDSMK